MHCWPILTAEADEAFCQNASVASDTLASNTLSILHVAIVTHALVQPLSYLMCPKFEREPTDPRP